MNACNRPICASLLALSALWMAGCAEVTKADHSLERWEDKNVPDARFSGAPSASILACEDAVSRELGVPRDKVRAYAGTPADGERFTIALHVASADGQRNATCTADSSAYTSDVRYTP